MSLNFIILKHVRGSELFDGRLESYGVFEGVPTEDSTKGAQCLYDEGGVLWAYMDEKITSIA
jgi:hypothetical protein